jgi:hypothetical protein
MIKCKICGREFKKQITNSHLKTHNITTEEYKKKFGEGSLSSKEYREQLSTKRSGENNAMYGKFHSKETREKMSKNRSGIQGRVGDYTEEGLSKIRAGIKRREERYVSGEIKRREYEPLDEETKNKISKSVKSYAEENHEELLERGKKAYKTRLKNGTVYIPSGPNTEEGKIKSKNAIIRANRKKKEKANKKINERVYELNFTLISSMEESPLHLKCNECNTEFSFTKQYFHDCKFFKEMCPTCHPRKILRSKGEEELYQFIKGLEADAIPNDRSQIPPMEIDVFLPSKNIGFEYSGLYWHSEELNKRSNRHKAFDNYKRTLAEKNGIKLFIIFEDEWSERSDIVKSRIKNILGKTSKRLYARKCDIAELSSRKANEFLKSNHIQGSGRSNIRFGLYHEDELVSVMTFSKENKSRNVTEWEINRFCHKLDYTVVGGASRLFKMFLNVVEPKSVISYADSRWSSGELYETLGFNLSHQTKPNYWYFYPNELRRIHRYSLRKNDKDDPNLTEYENRLKEGYLRIWDCGSTKWIYTN